MFCESVLLRSRQRRANSMVQNIPPPHHAPAILRSPEKERFTLQGNTHYEAQHYEKALTAYAMVLSLDPDDAFAHYRQGRALEGMQCYHEACAAYEQAIRLDPRVARFHVAQGNMRYLLKSYEEAERAFSRALHLDETLAEAYAGHAHTLRHLQQYERALHVYQHALRRDPDTADVHNGRGIALSKLERFDEAIGTFRMAVRLQPQKAHYHCNLGRTFQQRCRYPEALEEFDTAIALDPSYVRAYYFKGRLLLHVKREKEGRTCLAQARKLDPDEVKALDASYNTWSRAQGGRKEAKTPGDPVLRGHSSNGPSLLEQAQTLSQKGRYQASLEAYQKAVQQEKGPAEAWLGYVQTLCQLHQWTRALEVCKQARSQVRAKGALSYLEGNILLATKRYREAIVAYDTAKAQGYHAGDLSQKRALAQQNMKPPAPGRRVQTKAGTQQGSSFSAQHTEGQHGRKAASKKQETQPQKLPLPPSLEQISLIPSLFERGEALLTYQHYKEAQVVFEQLLREDARNAQAYISLGWALRGQGEEEQSLQAFQKAQKYRS